MENIKITKRVSVSVCMCAVANWLCTCPCVCVRGRETDYKICVSLCVGQSS